MKLRLYSDLHFEFMGDKWGEFVAGLPKSTKVDAVLLAGDITQCTRKNPSIPVVAKAFSDHFEAPVYFVPGNHEHYGNDIVTPYDQMIDCLRAEVGKKDRTFYGIGSNQKLGDRTIHSHTLWFGRLQEGDTDWTGMNDFFSIAGLTPWVYEINDHAQKSLRKHVGPGDIVLTHHLPIYGVIDPVYKNSRLNKFFANKLDDVIVKNKPALWAFGHTHTSIDTKVFDTRLVCNPYGYHGHSVNLAFKPDLIIEV